MRGHRLFDVGELDEVVLHPPIQRFLARWRPEYPVVLLSPLRVPLSLSEAPAAFRPRFRHRHVNFPRIG